MDSKYQWLIDILKLAVPAVLAWSASWATNRREKRIYLEKQEQAQRDALVSQSDRLFAGYGDMASHASQRADRLQLELVEAKTEAAIAQDEVARLQKELAEIKQRYEEVSELPAKVPKRRRQSESNN